MLSRCTIMIPTLEKVYYHYANTHDVLYNDIVVPNNKLHKVFKRLRIKILPLELAALVHELDPNNYGYVTYQSLRSVIGTK